LGEIAIRSSIAAFLIDAFQVLRVVVVVLPEKAHVEGRPTGAVHLLLEDSAASGEGAKAGRRQQDDDGVVWLALFYHYCLVV
jgi:hypothetical protein